MQDYKELVTAKLDMLAVFEKYVGPLKKLNDKEYRFRCPFHDDTNPSANVNVETGVWFCHGCQATGAVYDMVMRRDNVKFREALVTLGESVGLEPPKLGKTGGNGKYPDPADKPKLTEKMVEEWHEVALRNADLMRWFRDHRGFTEETVRKYQLGWDSERVTIPIRDAEDKLVNVRRYKRDSKTTQGKMLGFATGMNVARLFPMEALEEAEVLMVEGEWDCILARQHGFNAMTVTSGAGVFNNEWVDWFEGKSVLLCYDNDMAGQDGMLKVAQKLVTNPDVHVSFVRIPDLPEKGDITDFFVELGRTPAELQALMDDAEPFMYAPVAERGDPIVVPLHEASNAMYRGKYLETPVLVSGKAMTPYMVPFDYTVSCDQSYKKLCGICPLKLRGGTNRTKLDASQSKVLDLINVPLTTQRKALLSIAGAIETCPRVQIEVHESVNIEEVRSIPEIDTRVEAGDSEHVARTGFAIMHGLRSNRSYRARGYSHPHPKTQATVHVFNEMIPAQDNISSFEVATSLDLLRVFEGPTASQFAAIYEDFARNVHRIQGRMDMQVAYDLVWHSAIAFTFNGSYVRRGWTECMVMGDSGQGKTEMAMGLLGHYGLGARVQGEQASSAGLLGGLEKMGDTWILGWGALPLNDKRLLVIDETQGLDPSQIEALSDVRATGVAEITKIRTEKTNARVRLIWLANPVSGRPLAQHNQGVIAIRELFKKPEDVRRLDFAIVVASGDVPLSAVNAAHGEPGTPRFSAEASRALVLWAWSRLPHQVVFTPEATEAILTAATEMGTIYTAAIPLVEPADQRLKLARLSVAAAARVHSTDKTGELIVVTREHVDFVVDFLQRIYSAPAMAYDEFSGMQKQGEVLEPSEEDLCRSTVEAWTNSDEAQRFFRVANVFKKSELIDVVGWDEGYAKPQLRFLASHRLIRPTREGYVKTPVFIGLLRSMATGVLTVPSEDEAPF